LIPIAGRTNPVVRDTSLEPQHVNMQDIASLAFGLESAFKKRAAWEASHSSFQKQIEV
jgi:hypothetical protein